MRMFIDQQGQDDENEMRKGKHLRDEVARLFKRKMKDFGFCSSVMKSHWKFEIKG